MPNDTQIAELLTRIRQLESEVRELSARLEPAEAETDGRETPVARRGLLKQVGGVALGVTAATAAGQVLGASPAAAAQGAPLLLGTGNDPTSMTIYNCDLPGVAGFQTYNFGDNDQSIGFYSYGDGTGVMGRSAVRAGVIGMYDCPNEDIVRINRAGVGGVGSSGGVGVLGVSDTDGVVGQGSVGVRGTGTVVGVIGAGSGNQGHGLYGMIGPPSNLPAVSAAITGDTQDRPAIQGLSLGSDAVVGTSGYGRGGVVQRTTGGRAADAERGQQPSHRRPDRRSVRRLVRAAVVLLAGWKQRELAPTRLVSRDPAALRPLWINVVPGKAEESRSYWMYLGFSPTQPGAALAAAV